MRNSHLKVIRAEWKGRVLEIRYFNRLLMYAQSAVDRTGRLFFGRVSVMALALGTTPELEFMPGLSKAASVSTLVPLFLPFFGTRFHPSTDTASTLSACKDKSAFSSPHGHHQRPLSGSNHFLGQNLREWERSPPSTLPFLQDQ